MRNISLSALVLGLTSALSAGYAAAGTVDLTGVGSSTTINSVKFQQVTVQPTGTGVIDSFVRIQAADNEQGYNTDARPVAFDEKTDIHTRSLLLSDLVVQNISGTDYRVFLLDINEPGNITSENGLLALNQVKIYLGDAPDKDTTTLSDLGTKVYDLDDNVDTTLTLRDRNSGSGQGDYEMFVPDSLFAAASNGSNPYVYLFSNFGGAHLAQGGFEEWAAFENKCAPRAVPLPPAVWMGLVTMAGAMVSFGRKGLRQMMA